MIDEDELQKLLDKSRKKQSKKKEIQNKEGDNNEEN